MLLEVFPDAKFVHIHRNPYAVFQSTQNTVKKVLPWWAMQRSTILEHLDERTIRQYREVYERFFKEKGLIPKDRFHELSFEHLEADPIGEIRQIYEALALPDFQDVEPCLRRYVESLRGYQKNPFRETPAELWKRIARQWRRCFQEWGCAT